MILNHAQEWGLRVIKETVAEYIVGVDEVGLGACAGPAIVCAAVFKKEWPGHQDVKDSKQYTGSDSKKKHEKRVKALKEQIHPVLVHQEMECISHKDIDALGLGWAIEDAMRRVTLKCSFRFPGSVIALDGEFRPYLRRAANVIALPKGDALVPAISAASVIAKTSRDALMFMNDDIYPGYSFEDHVGYWTEKHRAALEKLGPCPIHRLSYKNIQAVIAARGAR